MMYRLLHGLAQLAADFYSEPVCDYCDAKCRGFCTAARKIELLEWALEVSQETNRQLGDVVQERDTLREDLACIKQDMYSLTKERDRLRAKP